MKRLLIGAALCALATPGFAADPAKVTTEPVTLSLTQMDKVTAAGWGDFCFCSNKNFTVQNANAYASADFSFYGTATAVATNVNITDQENN